jgi:hypoxanthine phosphoribosyltransferase
MEKKPVPLVSEAEIAVAIKRLAQELDRDYGDRSPLVVGVLKGSFIFLADLIRQIQTPLKNIELIRLASYHEGTVSSGSVKVLVGLPEGSITGEHVILVEDIVDTGLSTSTAFDLLQAQNPASLALCTLFDKPSGRKIPVTIDYTGIVLPDRFIVGYGLDFAEKYRQLPAIYAFEDLQ